MKKYGIQFGAFDTMDSCFLVKTKKLYFCSPSDRRSWLIANGYKFNAEARVWVYVSRFRPLRLEPAFITFKLK